jgi:hypothetical protein
MCQSGALWPLLFTFVIKKAQASQQVLKPNGTSPDDVNSLSKNINIGGENKIVISRYRRDWFGSKS